MGNYQNTRHHKGPRELATGGEWIYGRNPVIEALRAGRRTFTEIILPPGSKDEADEIASLRLTAQQRHIMIRTADRDRLDHLVTEMLKQLLFPQYRQIVIAVRIILQIKDR